MGSLKNANGIQFSSWGPPRFLCVIARRKEMPVRMAKQVELLFGWALALGATPQCGWLKGVEDSFRFP